jgi:hypothetical protein
VSGASYRHIASQFGIGYKSVERHATEHIAQTIQQSQCAQEEAQALNVVRQLIEINETTRAILTEARSERKNGMALFAIDRICKQIELQAKLLGDLDAPQVNLSVMPEWISIRTTIVQALQPYPEAGRAVAEALSRLEHASLN